MKLIKHVFTQGKKRKQNYEFKVEKVTFNIKH